MVDLDFLLGPLGSKDRRREGRQAAHGTVRIGGRTYELIDWSSSGFRAEGALEVSNEPDRIPIEFTITIDEEDYFFECNAFIVRSDPTQAGFAGVFVDLDERDRLAVAQYFEENAEGDSD